MELIEAFVYDRTTTTFDINESRLELFARKQRQYDTIRPTRVALLDHTKLATYRGGHVWGQAVTHDQHLPSPGDWEWVKENADGNVDSSLDTISSNCCILPGVTQMWLQENLFW
ncbi:Hypothetical predicted protein [Mytilus galloprovincialis]|uniref:Uncharacterized protein n=1 Tax=Mytilus galloprovincialis TaxID=29158 RepID=A0A8B6EIV1_MYTGA|nr:Hypothetical predicted protein [Mytilus galloprovincialis]